MNNKHFIIKLNYKKQALRTLIQLKQTQWNQ